MTGIQNRIEQKKRAETAKTRTREAMSHEARQAAGQDLRLGRYVEQEKAGLKKEARLAKARKDFGRG